MKDVKTGPHKSGDKTTPSDVPVGQALFSDSVWQPWTGENRMRPRRNGNKKMLKILEFTSALESEPTVRIVNQ